MMDNYVSNAMKAANSLAVDLDQEDAMNVRMAISWQTANAKSARTIAQHANLTAIPVNLMKELKEPFATNAETDSFWEATDFANKFKVA